MIKNVLFQINQEILKASKNNHNSSNVLQLSVLIVCKDLLRTFYKFLYLWFCDSSDQGKSAVTKLLLAILKVFLHENNCNYSSYRFVANSLSSLFSLS